MSKKSDILMKRINEKLGTSAVVRGTDIKLEPLKTGILNFDSLFTCGGLPRGDVVELFGEEGTGKTSFCYQYISNVQANGGVCLYIDREGKFNKERSMHFGVNTDDLIITDANDTEGMAGIIFEAAKSGSIDLIILDSLAAGGPKTLDKREDLDIAVGRNALMNNQFFRKWISIQNQVSNLKRDEQIKGIDSQIVSCLLLVVNQLRSTISIYSEKVRPGGRGKDYAAIARVKIIKENFFHEGGKVAAMTNKTLLESGEEFAGLNTKLFLEKNQAGKPFTSSNFQFYFDERGFDKSADVINYLLNKDIITRSGKWYYINGLHELLSIEEENDKIDGQTNMYKYINKLIKEGKLDYDKLG